MNSERTARKSHYEAVAKSNSERTKQKSIVVQMDKTKKEPILPVKPEQKPEPKEPPKPIHVREEVAKIAGVSSGTVARFEQVQKKYYTISAFGACFKAERCDFTEGERKPCNAY